MGMSHLKVRTLMYNCESVRVILALADVGFTF